MLVKLAFRSVAYSLLFAFAAAMAFAQAGAPANLAKAYRFERGGWTYVHLEGTPTEIGYQHGYLLSAEIADMLAAIKLEDTHDSGRNWEFFRETAREQLWPHIDAEYQQELQGIADGARAHGTDVDVYDVVALNAAEEVPDYYIPWLNKKEHAAAHSRRIIRLWSRTITGPAIWMVNAGWLFSTSCPSMASAC